MLLTSWTRSRQRFYAKNIILDHQTTKKKGRFGFWVVLVVLVILFLFCGFLRVFAVVCGIFACVLRVFCHLRQFAAVCAAENWVNDQNNQKKMVVGWSRMVKKIILGECPKLCRGASSCLMPVCHSQVLKTDHSSHIQWVLFLRRNALAHRSLLLSDMFLILWCMLLCSVSFVQNAGGYNHWNPVHVWEERPLWSKTSFADTSLGSM